MPEPQYEFKETLLRVEHVSLELGGNLILRDVNAEVKEIIRPGSKGQVVGLLGPSGIGKTQFFKIMAGLQQPSSGIVCVNAEVTPVQRGQVGVVAQNYPLFRHRTVLGNLIVAAVQKGLSSKEAREKAMSFLSRFELSDHALKYPEELSGGQRQRVAIVQQLLCSDHFLLMDEPFSGLDLLMMGQVCSVISEVAGMDELNTIIVITHDISAAVSIADTLWLMGRDRDEKDNIIPGAYVKRVVNLIDEDLAWHPEIATTPQFAEFVRQLKVYFKTL
jgi:ABC-type nitrate/sulfonate/bicarbonate transport system ATPase subunit